MLEPSFFEHVHVLLVDDDRTHREFVAEILERLGCKVVIAYNGKDALSLVTRHRFDLIVMDVEMPEMDGLSAARRIRELRRHGEVADVPIIALTAHREPEMEKACLDAGMVAFLPKDIWKPRWEPEIRRTLMRWVLRTPPHNNDRPQQPLSSQ